GDHFAGLHGDCVQTETVVIGREQIGSQHLVVRCVIGRIEHSVVEPGAVGTSGQGSGSGNVVGDLVVPIEVLQRHIGGVCHGDVVAHRLAGKNLRVAA